MATRSKDAENKQAEQDKQEKPSVDVEVAGDAQSDPRGQTVGDTPQPQMLVDGGAPKALEGDQEAIVNPALSTLSVSIPTGYNEDGTTKFDNFEVGKTHKVDPSLLEVLNTEGKALLVDPNKEEGGE